MTPPTRATAPTQYVLRVLGLVGVQLAGSRDPAGLYVQDYDPDGNSGLGDVALCSSVDDAKRYATATEAALDYRRASSVRPLRVDGQPNRPLTAYAIEVIPVPWRTT